MCSCCRILERARVQSPDIKNEKKEQRFEKINIHLVRDKCWREKVTLLAKNFVFNSSCMISDSSL